ncbi:hypothetical protein J6590_077657 [Homalodisca vitripennis]|nr:hypothetical protein J6590_077657 [Homalodisca vitripennis]
MHEPDCTIATNLRDIKNYYRRGGEGTTGFAIANKAKGNKQNILFGLVATLYSELGPQLHYDDFYAHLPYYTVKFFVVTQRENITEKQFDTENNHFCKGISSKI